MDDRLESLNFDKFPLYQYRFSSKLITKNSNETNWMLKVKLLINQIVDDFYQIPYNYRSTYQILTLIDKYRNDIDMKLFQSEAHYYSVLAVLCDQLIHSLLHEQNVKPPQASYDVLNKKRW